MHGVDIVELKAIYAVVKNVKFDNDGDGSKAQWRDLIEQATIDTTMTMIPMMRWIER